jgi:soluble lytic murein transglycosylase-like protein
MKAPFALAMCLVAPVGAKAFCFTDAAQAYGVDERLLRAIATVESNNNPNAIGINTNGSKDYGLMQINSQHFPILARFNITEQNIMEPCLNVKLGAWILAKSVQRHGATWRAVGAYNAGGGANREAQRQTYAHKVWRAQLAAKSEPPSAKPPPDETRQEKANISVFWSAK